MLVRNFSVTGMLIETAAELRPGATILVSSEQFGGHEATVVWSGGRYHGALFATPLSRSELGALTDLDEVVWPIPLSRDLRHKAATPGPNPQAMLIAAMQAFDGLTTEHDKGGLSLQRRVQIVLISSLLMWLGLAAALPTWLIDQS